MQLSRRQIIRAGVAGLAFSGLAARAAALEGGESYVNEIPGYGPLIRDPRGVIDLPRGFSYRVVSRAGELMDDGLVTPGQFDGMGCFPLGGSRVALVRNHELDSRPEHTAMGPAGPELALTQRLSRIKAYGARRDGTPLPGGTTTVVYDLATGRTVRQHLSLAGTAANCCGGQTPWGSWLSCEETEDTALTADVSRTHGYVFEVPAKARGPVEPVALTSMGRFSHEAVCIDPRTGVAYLTEDKVDGLFYRFIPERPGDLRRGGRLQAMAFRADHGGDSSNHAGRAWAPGDWRAVDWIDLSGVDSPHADLRMRGHAAGATLVSRGEGIHWGAGELYLTATSGGPLKRGQVLRYVPSGSEAHPSEARDPGRVQLFFESGSEQVLNMGDNLTVAPWGDLVVCEDNYSDTIPNHLKVITSQGKSFTLGRNALAGNSEFAGAVFAPGGRTLFVNIQHPGTTLAITGPWRG